MRTESCSYLIYIRYTIHNVECQDLREVLLHPIEEKASDFQVTFDDNIYLNLGLEAK